MQVDQGPVGSGHGSASSNGFIVPAGATITGVFVCHGDYINGIGLQVTQNDQTSLLNLGGTGATHDFFTLNPGEYITGFAGSYGDVINTLVIYTNQRCSAQYGSVEGGARYYLTLPANLTLAGMLGAQTGGNVEMCSLGITAQEQSPVAVPTSCPAVRMGPGGDAGGGPWLESLPYGAQFQTIRVWATGSDVCGFQVLMQSGGNTLPNPQVYGSQSGTESSLNFQANEYITSVTGTCAGTGDGNVNTLTITTTNLQVMKCGSNAGPFVFNFSAPPGGQILGFFGRAGSKIDAIGVIASAVQTNAPVFEDVWDPLTMLRTPAVAAYGTTLYAMVAPVVNLTPVGPSPTIQSGPLQIAAFNLADLNGDGTLPVAQTSSQKFGQNRCDFSLNAGYTQIGSHAGVSAAVAGDFLWVFWQDDKGSMVAQLNPQNSDLSQPTARKPWCTLQDDTGNPLPGGNQADVSAVTLGSTTVLVGTVFNNSVYIGRYELGDIQLPPDTSNEPGSWKARQTWSFSLAQLQAAAPALPSCGSAISIEWYASSGESAWLAISLWDSQHNTAFLFWLPLDIVSMPLMYLGDSPGSSTVTITGQSFPNAYTPMSLRKDPAGRIRMYFAGPEFSLAAYTQPANALPGASIEFDSQPLTDSKSQPFSPVASTPYALSAIAPVAVFPMSSNTVLTTVVNDPDNLPNPTNPAQPVSEAVFAFNAGANQLVAASRAYGRLQAVTGLVGTPIPQDIITVHGITDGPFPLPNENTIPYTFPGGFPSQVGNIVYGTELDASQTRTFNYAWTRGYSTQGESTKGLGPCWDIAISGGTGGGTVDTQASQIVKQAPFKSYLNSDQSVNNQAGLFAVGMNFNTALYRFLSPFQDGSGNYEVVNDACRAIATAGTFAGENDQRFTPYDVTPGDITSYTIESWNRRMQQLGYPGPTYFEDVILANAYEFDVGGQQQNYYEIDWTPSTLSSTAFGPQTSTSVKDFSWTFDSSIYAGISYGEGFEFLGMGMNMQAQYMSGVTVSLNGSTETQTQEQWGVALDSIYCPPPTNGKPGYLSYTWRLYFLPASSQWIDEFLAYSNNPTLKATIDPNSKPWRIVYAVMAYEYQDANGNIIIYPPANIPAVPGAAPVVDTQNGVVAGQFANNGHSLWSSGNSVQYAISFVNAAGESDLSAWSAPVTIGDQICAGVTLPLDLTGSATSRKLYRQFVSSSKPELVLTILDNTTQCFDAAPAVNFAPPATSLQVATDPNQWAARSNFPNSNVWIPGNQVQYAVSFVYSNGETVLGPWSAWETIGAWAFPTLNGLPCSADVAVSGQNTPVCMGRKIYRNCQGPGPSGGTVMVESQTLVATIAATGTTAADPPPSPSQWTSSVTTSAQQAMKAGRS